MTLMLREHLHLFSGNGRSSNGFFYGDDSNYYADPPPATSWPAPKPEYQNEMEEPVPDWVVQTEDDEPPELSRSQQYLETWIISQIVIRCNNW